jgi:hypothetical protein
MCSRIQENFFCHLAKELYSHYKMCLLIFLSLWRLNATFMPYKDASLLRGIPSMAYFVVRLAVPRAIYALRLPRKVNFLALTISVGGNHWQPYNTHNNINDSALIFLIYVHGTTVA